MIPKEIKCNLHYDDVRGDFLRPQTYNHQINEPAVVKVTARETRSMAAINVCICHEQVANFELN